MINNILRDKKKSITALTWEYLLKSGVENATIRKLCKYSDISQSSLYYWFSNKDDIWLSAGKYGLSKVIDELLDYTLIYKDNFEKYFDTLINKVEKYKYELRTVIQLITSPIFGDRLRDKSKELNFLYDKHADELEVLLGCSHSDAQGFIYSLISFAVDYAIWNDKEKARILLGNLYNSTIRKIQYLS